jgi:hypothetical protein
MESAPIKQVLIDLVLITKKHTQNLVRQSLKTEEIELKGYFLIQVKKAYG